MHIQHSTRAAGYNILTLHRYPIAKSTSLLHGARSHLHPTSYASSVVACACCKLSSIYARAKNIAYQFAVQDDSFVRPFVVVFCAETRLTASRATPRFSFSATTGTMYAEFLPFSVFGLRATNCFAALGRADAAEASGIPPLPKHLPDRKSSRDSLWSISTSRLPMENSEPSPSLCAPSTP